MFRQIRFRVLNETLPDFRTWPNQFLDMFRDPPLARLLQRPDPFDPDDADAPGDGLSISAAGKPADRHELPADRVGPVESPGDRPVLCGPS